MLVRPVMKRLFFPWKPRKKRLASLARLIVTIYLKIGTPSDRVYLYQIYHPILLDVGTIRTIVRRLKSSAFSGTCSNLGET